MNILLAWRNIWRNPRRTAVILLAVIIGVWCMLFLGALTRGAERGMIENGIAALTGHIQIHAKGYRNDPIIQKNITDMEFVKAIHGVMGIVAIVLAALILADGVLGLTGSTTELFSLAAFKLAVGFIALLLSATLLEKSST